MTAVRTVAILGATGSIGDSALDVVARHPERFAVAGLAAHRQWEKLAGLCRRFRPRVAALLDPDAAHSLARAIAADGLPTDVLSGVDGLCAVATLAEADTVLAAIVGASVRRRAHEQVSADDQRLLVGEQDALAGACRGQRRQKPGGANDRGEDRVDFRQRGGFGESGRAGQDRRRDAVRLERPGQSARRGGVVHCRIPRAMRPA